MSTFPSNKLLEQAIDPQPLTVAPDVSIADTIWQMNQHQTSYIAIVEGEKLVGLFTERDVVRLASQNIDFQTLKIDQVMSPQLVTLSPAQSQDLFSVMSLLNSAQIRHLPITDDCGKLLGIITPQSLRQALNPADLLQIRRVSDLMVSDVLSAPPTASVLEIAEQMAQQCKSCILICPRATENDPQKPVGIITERDIVRFKVQELDFEATSAAEVMSTPLFPVQPDVSLWDAHQLMRQHRFRRLVVTDETGALLGIVTQSTLIQALNPVDINTTIELLQHTIADKTQALRDANTQMQQEVAQRIEAEAEVRRLNAELEARVLERTAQLENSNQELQATLKQLQATQDELIHAEKMVALGQLIGGVAHEINTPLGAIRSSASNLSGFLTQTLQELPTFFQQLSPELHADFFALLERSNSSANNLSHREKRKAKRQLIDRLEAEEIADADRIADTLVDIGIYEEVSSFFSMLKTSESETILDAVYRFSSLNKSTEIISIATERAAKVVSALKQYIYPHNPEKTSANILEGIETVLTLYHNQFKQGVDIVRNYEDCLPEIWCYPDELQQVWMNLIQNALHAMENQGTISIDVGKTENSLVVSITDTGKGIAIDDREQIFQIFFTTKTWRDGSGMGLYLVKNIINKHGGTIDLESYPGKTRFTIALPLGDEL